MQRRPARAARAAALALVLVVAGACSGGGGSKTATASEFADATCVDLANWATTVQRAFAELQNIGQFDASQKSAAQDQLKRLSKELADADQATAELASGISSRNAPSIASGDQVKKTIVDTLNGMREITAKTRTEIDAFDVTTATPQQSTKLKSDIEGLTNNVAESLSGLAPLLSDNAELRSAFEGSATCRQAGSSLASS